MSTIFWLLIIVAITLFIAWPTFRNFIMNAGANISTIAANFVRLYSIAALVVLGVIVLLVFTGLFIPSGVYKGLAFGLAAGLVYAIWLPAGIILRIFRVKTFPKSIKALAAWLCFVGFLGVLYPDTISSFKLILLTALAVGIFSGMTVKINALEKLVFPIVVILLIITGIKYIFPDTYRANTGFLKAIGGAENTAADRGSLRIKSYSTATYGHLKKDVRVAYKKKLINDIPVLRDINVNLKKDDVFLLVSHKNEIFEYNGQGFVEIRLPKANGSYVGGKKMWVEVDLVEIGSREAIELDPETTSEETIPSSQPEESVTEYWQAGEYPLNLADGEESGWLKISGQCLSYTFTNRKATFILTYKDGTIAHSWDGKPWPGKYTFKVKNLSKEQMSLKLSS